MELFRTSDDNATLKVEHFDIEGERVSVKITNKQISNFGGVIQ